MARYIGKEMSRVDSVAKVTGKAKYAAEFQVPNVAYAFIVTSSIGKGTINSIDTTEASGAPGVICILTHENYPKLAASAFCGLDPATSAERILSPFPALQSSKILLICSRSLSSWRKHSNRPAMPHVS
jgi:xanthine dehydrogenase YagR molybdenum-binding subunit